MLRSHMTSLFHGKYGKANIEGHGLTQQQAGSKQTAYLLPTSKFKNASNPHAFSSPSAYEVGQTSQDIQSCKRPTKIIASNFWIHTVPPKVQSIFRECCPNT